MAVTLVLQGGTVVDGSGDPGFAADVALDGDRILGVERRESGTERDWGSAPVLDASGQVVAPGFINALSHAWGSLQRDPTGASDLLQGVTTEVFGEAFSLGPSDATLSEALRPWDDLVDDARVEFDRLSQGLDFLAGNGIAPNVASFVGGHNLRLLGAGFDDRPLDSAELDRLRALLAEEMQDGALGIGTALIYPPGRFARTDELTALCEVVGEYDGTYISHMRSEGDQLLECLAELLGIVGSAGCRGEVYHLKAAGQANWPKMAAAVDRIEQARTSGLDVAANMYPYTAGGTALAACIPPRFHVGGPKELLSRLGDPATRGEMATEIRQPSNAFENLYLAAGGGSGIRFFSDFADGTPGNGRHLDAVAADLGLDEVDALLDLVARFPETGAGYFIIDETNIELGLGRPWVSAGSDAAAHQAIQPFTDEATHPRTYGTFARFLGHYGRDRGLFSVEEGVRRMTSLPAANFRLLDRGHIRPGGFADLVVFDPETIADFATYSDPHQYSTGIRHVLVNGEPVVMDGTLTHATPGRRLRRAG